MSAVDDSQFCTLYLCVQKITMLKVRIQVDFFIDKILAKGNIQYSQK